MRSMQTTCKTHSIKVQQFWKYVCITASAIICYANCLDCGLVFDDISAIKSNKDLRPHQSALNLLRNDFWGTPIHKEQSHKSFRPLCVLTFRWNYYFHGTDPFGYHLVNIVLHVLVCLLFYRICQLFSTSSSCTSFLATLLYTIHPVHTEAVTGVVGRAELLSAFFYLLTLLFYCRRKGTSAPWSWSTFTVTFMLATAATLSKEQGITCLAICLLHDFLTYKKMVSKEKSANNSKINSALQNLLCRMISIVITVGILLLGRFHIMGGQLPKFSRFDNPAAVSEMPTRQLTYNYLLALNSWLLLFPSSLCCDWTMGSLLPVNSIFDRRNIATILVYLTLTRICLLFFKKHIYGSYSTGARDTFMMGFFMIAIPFVPASNLFFPVGFVLAERVLYIPSMGFCMIISEGYRLVLKWTRKKWLIHSGLVILLLSHSLKTIRRNRDWKSEYTLFTSGLQVNPRNAKLLNNVGHTMESVSNYDTALEFFKKAESVEPDDIGTHINIGRTLSNLNRHSEAEAAFIKALNLLPKPRSGESYTTRVTKHHLSVFLNLATLISQNASRLEEADKLYKQAIRLREDYTQAYINRGDVLIKLNRTQEAQETYQKALQYEENNPDIYHNLAIVSIETGNLSMAMEYLNKALEIDPDHRPSLVNSAVLVQEYGMTTHQLSAYKRLLKVIEKGNVKDEAIYFNLGMMALDLKDFINAETMLRSAIKYKKDFKGALFNLALLLSDQGRLPEAAHFLHQLLKHHPRHANGLLLLGDIYINHMNDLDEAEKCYRTILSIDPSNVQSLHNLCVIFYKKMELVRAERCLLQAEKLAPNEQYIQTHLSIVQKELSRPTDTIEGLQCLQDSSSLSGKDCLVSKMAALPTTESDSFIK